jgi:hypothetical protein
MSETPEHQLGDAPISDDYAATMRRVATVLDQVFNATARGDDRETGFILLVFPFGSTGRCNYISNGADRGDVVKLLKEQLAHFEGQAG